MFNFLSDLTGFICQEQVFAIQYNVLFRLQLLGLLARELCLTIFPIKSRLGLNLLRAGLLPAGSQVHSWNSCWVETYPGVHPTWICKGFQCYLHVFCRALPCALLSYLIWGFLLFESSQEDAGGADLIGKSACYLQQSLSPVGSLHGSHCSGMCPLHTLLFQPQAVHKGFFKSSPVLMKTWH